MREVYNVMSVVYQMMIESSKVALGSEALFCCRLCNTEAYLVILCLKALFWG
jgi:hypothetical protein